MKETERKKVVHEEIEEVIVGRVCDICKKKIEPEKHYGVYDYFKITTHHHDWGNDSIESYEYYDACSPECAIHFANNYLQSAFGQYSRNTRTVEIEHCNSLEEGADDRCPF